MTHSFYVIMGGFALHDPQNNIYRPVHPKDFVKRLSNGDFGFPELSEAEIMDKSKGDEMAKAKALAVIKMLWFCTQLIGRLIRGWAATELEVLAFSTCVLTLVIYGFWWNKPFDVRCQTPLTATTRKAEPSEGLHAAEALTMDQSMGKFRTFDIYSSHFAT